MLKSQNTGARRRRVLFGCALAALGAVSTQAQELIYQEGFNDDGVATGRYTVVGGDVYEVPRIQSDLNFYDQKGPLYWARSQETTFVGVPNIPARRALFAWRSDPAGGAATEDFLKLWESTVSWLMAGKTAATIVVNPTVESIGELADRLVAAGHTVVADDTGTFLDEQDVPGDLFIHGPAANNPSRFAMVPKPVIVINEPDYDDMLVGSIGTLATFDPGPVTIAAPGHPAAGGKTGSFTAFNSPAQPFGLIGSFLPPGATVLATVTRTVPPAINNLTDVAAVIAGTKQHESSAGTVSDLDFADASPGQWGFENTIPGGYTANWGLRVQGKLAVSTAGTYRLALGSDDGAHLWIDRDRNGITASDTILEDPGPHGHQIVYADVNFPSAGDYDFEIRAYNSGSGGSLELSTSIDPVPVPDDALDSGYWELVSESGTSPVKLKSAANVTGYNATGPNVQVETPLIVLLNGPTDTPPGTFYDGGAFTGFEGSGFFGASGINKWTYPAETGSYRSVRLKPVSVAGKNNVKLTIACAATVVDFETSDFLDVVVFPNGANSTPVTLAHFRGVVNAIQPWLADEKENYSRRLTKQFADFTYDIPAGATDLIVEIRAATTWWTEIAAFDNIRITAGTVTQTPPNLSIARNGANVQITFDGVLESRTAVDNGTWTVVPGSGSVTIQANQLGGAQFYRARRP